MKTRKEHTIPKKDENGPIFDADLPKKAEKRQVKANSHPKVANFDEKRTSETEEEKRLKARILNQFQEELEQKKKKMDSSLNKKTQEEMLLREEIERMIMQIKNLKRKLDVTVPKKEQDENLFLLIQEYFHTFLFYSTKDEEQIAKDLSTFFLMNDFLLSIDREINENEKKEEEFNKEQKQLKEMEELKDHILRRMEEEKKEISYLKKKVIESGTFEIKEEEIKITKNHTLENLFLLGMLPYLPHSLAGNSARLLFIYMIAKNMEEELHPTYEAKITKVGIYEDYQNMITDSISSINLTMDHIEDALTTLKDMEKVFIHDFQDSIDSDLFHLIATQLESVIDTLTKQKKEVSSLQDEMASIDKLNYEKVKTYSNS